MRKPQETNLAASWRRFLLIRVPVAAIGLLLVLQALAMALERVPLRRSYMDDLALAVGQDSAPHRVVLLGDSITLVSTRGYQLGRGLRDVANLSTIAWTGAAAELFLLERYLASHPAPDYVVYASAPDDLDNRDSAQLLHYYDWNVYTLPRERAFMRQYIPGIDARETLPAALNIQENILERLVSLTKRTPPSFPEGERVPNPAVVTEPVTGDRMDLAIQRQRLQKGLSLGALEMAVLRDVCRLSEHYGFKLVMVWPPLPSPISKEWRGSGQMAALDASIAQVGGKDCRRGPGFDVNSLRAYTNFNRDGFHLHGSDWEERYAADLSAFIATLPDHRNTDTSSLNAPGRD